MKSKERKIVYRSQQIDIYKITNQHTKGLKGRVKSLSLLVFLCMLISAFVALPAEASTTTTNVTYDTQVESSMLQNGNHSIEISLVVADNYEFYGGEYYLIDSDIYTFNPNYPSGYWQKYLIGKYAILNGSVSTDGSLGTWPHPTSASSIIKITSLFWWAENGNVNGHPIYTFTFPCDLYGTCRVPDVYYAYSGKVPSGAPSYGKETPAVGSSVAVKSSPAVIGYDFSGWESGSVTVSNGRFTMPGSDVTFKGSWIPRTDTPFTMEFYQRPIIGDSYIKVDADTQAGTGTTDTKIVDNLDMTTLNAKYPGFHLSSDSANDTTTIAGNGSATIKLNYDRNTPNIIYSSGTATKSEPSLPATKTARYEATITVADAPTLVGYDFGGWTSDDVDLSSGQTTFSMPDNDVHIVANWIPLEEPYTVEYYSQELDGSYTLTDTENCTGYTDSQAIAPAKSYEGFTETDASKDAEANTTINGDGKDCPQAVF